MNPTDSSHFGFLFSALPMWRWEPDDAAKDAAEPAPAAALDSECTASADGEAPAALPQMRLIYKGYEWQPVAQWYPVVDPAWDYHTDNDPDEIRERGLRQDRERQQAQQSGLAQRQHAQAASGPAPDDPSGASGATGVGADAALPDPSTLRSTVVAARASPSWDAPQ